MKRARRLDPFATTIRLLPAVVLALVARDGGATGVGIGVLAIGAVAVAGRASVGMPPLVRALARREKR